MDDKKIPYSALPQGEDAPPAYETNTETPLRQLINTTGLVSTPQMMIGGVRNAKSMPVSIDGKRSFNHGLCNCLVRPAASAVGL